MGGYRRRGVPRFDLVRIALYGNVTHAPRALTADRGEHDDRADALSQHRAGHPAPGLAHGNYHLSLWAVHQADRDATSDRHGLPAPGTHPGLALNAVMGGYGGPLSRGVSMPLVPVLLLASNLVVQRPTAQTPAPAAAPAGATPIWTARFSGDVRWQQVTPAGALLVSTDGALAAVDIERGQIVWQKPELGGLPADSVRMVEGSLLMEAARPGLLVVFDPVTGTAVFDSRRLNLAQIVTRRALPQSGTLLVHGRRAAGPPVVALYDLASGEQRWANEGLFEQTGPQKKGLGGLMQRLVTAASEATALDVLQAGTDPALRHNLMGRPALAAPAR